MDLSWKPRAIGIRLVAGGGLVHIAMISMSWYVCSANRILNFYRFHEKIPLRDGFFIRKSGVIGLVRVEMHLWGISVKAKLKILNACGRFSYERFHKSHKVEIFFLWRKKRWNCCKRSYIMETYLLKQRIIAIHHRNRSNFRDWYRSEILTLCHSFSPNKAMIIIIMMKIP